MTNLSAAALAESYAACCRLARRTGRNFYYSFLVLPRPLYRSMCALYAYMRICDDLADDETFSREVRQANLQGWRKRLREAFTQEPVTRRLAEPIEELLPAICDMVERHRLPTEYLFDVITGVEMDLEPRPLATVADLERYCYHVAGVVGLCCIRLWGYHDPQAEARAIDCGFAFQLTNILRDLNEDAANDRCYLPQEDLERFGYRWDDLKQRTINPAFLELMRFEMERARASYARAEELFPLIDPVGRPILRAMISIYRGLLDEIERRNFDVFRERVRLPSWKKAWWTAAAWWRRG